MNWPSSGSENWMHNIILKIFGKNISGELQNGSAQSQKLSKISIATICICFSYL